MYHKHPVTINIMEYVDEVPTIKQMLIFAGKVPNVVKVELKKFLTDKTYTSKLLSNFYDKHWLSGIKKKVKTTTTIGGLNEDILEETDVDNISNIINLEDDPNDADDEFSADNLEILSNIDLSEIDQLNMGNPKIISNTEELIVSSNIDCYPFDTIMDLKEKIYAITGILPAFQHMWVQSNQNIVIPMYYKIHNYNHSINITNCYEVKDRIFDIPINSIFYDNYAHVKIEALDTFEIVDNIYKKYATNEFYIIDLHSFMPNREKINNVVKQDTYQAELLYYGFVGLYWPMITFPVFLDWLNDELIKYPDIFPNQQNILYQYIQESEITRLITQLESDKSIVPQINNKLKLGITNTFINVFVMGDNANAMIDIRNLFDKLELDSVFDYCKASIYVDNKKFFLKKVYNANTMLDQIWTTFHPALDKIGSNSIIIRVRLNPSTIESLYFVFYQNGNYTIKTTWREELEMDFDKIYTIVSKYSRILVDLINSYGSKVLFRGNIIHMSKKNVVFNEINVSLFWQHPISDNHFKFLKKTIHTFRSAGIIRDKSISDNEFYFKKGMFQYESHRIDKSVILNNYYEYMSNGIIKQKWENMFSHTRIFKMIHRAVDIKLEISGIKEQEFDVFIKYVYILFYTFLKSNDLNAVSKLHRKKILSDNKQQDPELYDSRKLQKSDFVYSRICQKPYQPMILTDIEYKQLPQYKQKRVVTFWNYTKKSPALYYCPNDKFPYLRFLIDQHPLGYCVPCCKILPVPEDKNNPKKIIHDVCLNKHICEEKKKTMIVTSTYIMSYGRDIELGRLSRLPESTLEMLFTDTYINTHSIDQECSDQKTTSYYLLGVEQHLPSIQFVGLIHCAARALNYTAWEFYEQIKSRVLADNGKYNLILNGEILGIFQTPMQFCHSLENMFSVGLNSFSYNTINNIIISILYLYFSINVIKFEDTNGNFYLRLPPRLNNIDDFLNAEYQNLIVLYNTTTRYWYPVFLFNTEVYFRLKIIDETLFTRHSEICLILEKIVQSQITNEMYHKWTINLMKNVCESFGYKFNGIFINKNNYAYAVMINEMYIPINYSFYSSKHIITEPFIRYTSNCKFSDLNNFIKDFNTYVAQESEKKGFIKYENKNLPIEQRVEPIYPFIELTHWICLINKKVIGFKASKFNFYFNPSITIEEAKNTKKIPLYILHHDPDDVIMAISKPPQQINWFYSIYKYYEYQLLLAEFAQYFSKQSNTDLRKQVINLVSHKLGNIGTGLSEILVDNDDLNTIHTWIKKILLGEITKSQFVDKINLARFQFDMVELIEIRSLNKQDRIQKLKQIADKFVIEMDDVKSKITSFKNMFEPCQDYDSSYCSGKKLIIEKGRLDVLLDIMSEDVVNPFKVWLFSSLFIDRVINAFQFIKRPNERIRIETK
jgi:hypothetical protein